MNKKFSRTLLGQCILTVLFSWKTLAQTAEPDTTLALNYLAPTSYHIEDIRITGTKILEPEALRAMIALKAGDIVQIPSSAITDAIKKLWQQKLIQDVAIYASRVVDKRIILTIDITESPRLSAYAFEGLRKREQKELKEKISLAKGKIITGRLIKNTQKTLQEYLVSQGYLDAVVNITSLPDPALPDYKQVTIHIDKGEKFIINKILLQGNHKLDDKVLKAQLQHIQEKPRFTLVRDILKKALTLQPLRKGGLLRQMPSLEETLVYLKYHVIPFPSKLIQAKYTEDKKRLINYYQTKGYRDATIVADTIHKHKGGLLDVQLQLEEGQQYFIRNIAWVGNYSYHNDTLNQILDIHPGDVYNPALIQERLFLNPAGKDVASLYMDEGYLFFNAEPVEVRIEGNTVDLAIRIQEGPQAYINRVNIQGNTWTHDQVIRRELRTLPGDKFSRAKLLRSQRELTMLNTFDPAKLKITPIPSPTDTTVDLVYEVKENPKFEIRGGGSFGGGASSPAINLTLSINNFSLRNALQGKRPLGEAQTIQLNAEFCGKNYQNFTFQFIEPWLGGKKPQSLSLAISQAFQHEEETSTGSLGGKIGLGTRLKWPDDYTELRSSLGFYQHRYENYDLLDNQQKLRGVMYDLSLSTSIERNSTDDPIYPTQGSEFGLHLQLTPPYAWFSRRDYRKLSTQAKYKWKEYHQWIVDGSYFQKLFGDWLLNIRGHGGILGGYSTKQGIGPFKRFAMGSTSLMDYSLLGRELIALRGYAEECILPQDKKRGYKGGTIFNKVALELRHPLVKSPVAYIYALAFAEAGNTWPNYKDWQPLDLKRSVGLGIRLYIPLGTIELNWGYGFDKAQRDKLEFHWSFGGSVR